MHRDDSKEPWGLASFEPPPFEETRLLGLTEQSLPVRPLRSPLERALLLAILAVGLGALVLLATSLRTDLGRSPGRLRTGRPFWNCWPGPGCSGLPCAGPCPGRGRGTPVPRFSSLRLWAWPWPRPWWRPISLPGIIPASASGAPLEWA